MKLSQAHNPSLYSHSYYFIIRLVSHPSLCHCALLAEQPWLIGMPLTQHFTPAASWVTAMLAGNRGETGREEKNNRLKVFVGICILGWQQPRLQLIALNGSTVRQCQLFQCQHTHTHTQLSPRGTAKLMLSGLTNTEANLQTHIPALFSENRYRLQNEVFAKVK